MPPNLEIQRSLQEKASGKLSSGLRRREIAPYATREPQTEEAASLRSPFQEYSQ